MTNDLIEIRDAPAIPGLSFRHFRGSSDYPLMAAAIAASAEADQVERVTTTEDIAISYAHLTNSDPYQDMLFAEMNGEVIGYSRGWWNELENGPVCMRSWVFLSLPGGGRGSAGLCCVGWKAACASSPADIPRNGHNSFKLPPRNTK